MRQKLPALSLALLLAGCGANFLSIERRTELPSTPLQGTQGQSEGKAIHLDAKQRIVFSKSPGVVCAEPSPDALSAFASSFGGGLAVPQYGSLAISQALSESAASIGLRTQSITLMRDALYRVCEAAYNGSINPVMVMQLLGRSQDLTLAILAIEQLTQPVVAQQAALGGSSSSTSSANLLVSQQLLDAAREHESQANDKVTAAKTKQDAAVKTEADKKAAYDKLNAQQNPPADAKDIESARSAWVQAQLDSAKATQAATDAEAAATDAKKNRETIEKSNGNAQASASANAASSAVLSAPITLRPPPSDESMKAIATAVDNIVKTVVKNDHRVDACLSFKSALIPTRTDREQKKANAALAKDKAMMLSLQTQEEKDKTTEDVCDIILAQALKSLLKTQ